MGVGGAPEGVITAAAMRCLGGEIQARLVATNDHQRARLRQLGYEDLTRVYQTEDLAPGEQILVACTGVTDGELLHGVRFFGAGTRCSTLFTSAHQQIIRFVDTIHRLDPEMPVLLR